jgi:ketosteroid isomerase-like protein
MSSEDRREGRTNDFETLQELNEAYIRSVARSDASWFERHLAPDFVNINADGSIVDRAGFLAQVARPIAASNLRAEDVRIRIIGDVAVVNARTMFSMPDGQTGSRRYTDVWSRQGNRWRCVSAQVTSTSRPTAEHLHQAQPKPADGQTIRARDEAFVELKALNAKFIHNFITNDVKSHDAILHERFVSITSKGEREGRQKYLARWATGFDPEVFTYWDTRNEHIDIFGSLALVRATNKYIANREGKQTIGMTTYTDTYIHQDGRWQCIQAQLTAVSPEHFPGDDTVVATYIKGRLQPTPR